MNGAYVHLLLNHFPFICFFLAIIFLVIGWLSRSLTLGRSGMALVIFSALITIPVYLSGEHAEHVVEGLSNVSQEQIEIHEAFATKAVWLVWATGILSLIALAWSFSAKKISNLMMGLITLAAVAAAGAVAWTNKLGGEVSHPELRNKQNYEIDRD